MKRSHAIVIVLVLLLLGALIFYLAPEREVVAPDVGERSSMPPAQTVPAPPVANDETAPAGVDPGALDETPQMRAYRERQAFEQSLRDFLDEAQPLTPAEREARATALVAGVDQYEQAGQLSAAEAVALRLALLRETGDDDTYARESARILSEYKARNDAAMQAFIDNQPPEFINYKAREREIVREVQQMTEFPGGMTRAQYLRERLQAAREESYHTSP